MIISDKISIPNDAVTQTFACIGRKGAGKTYLATLLAEQMLTIGAQVVIIDPVGNWFGLRVGKDGKSKGKDIFIEEIKKMSTVPAGLSSLEAQQAALTTAVTALTAAVTAAVTTIQNAVAEAGEDATVGSIASTIGTQVSAINTAVTDLQNAVTPPASSTPSA